MMRGDEGGSFLYDAEVKTIFLYLSLFGARFHTSPYCVARLLSILARGPLTKLNLPVSPTSDSFFVEPDLSSLSFPTAETLALTVTPSATGRNICRRAVYNTVDTLALMANPSGTESTTVPLELYNVVRAFPPPRIPSS